MKLALILLATLAALVALPVRPDERLPVFDAHLHYNAEMAARLPADRVLALLAEHGVSGVLANSTPNDGTRALLEARPAKLRVVPFLRPYRTAADAQRWFRDPATLELIAAEFPRAAYAGIGEFHVHGEDAATDVVKGVVDFARRHRLLLYAHSDSEALGLLFRHDPDARIIWAHAGFSAPAEEVEALLRRHPNLRAELSYRSGLTDAGGRLTPAWDGLLRRHPGRFLLGSDTWSDARWDGYGGIIAGYRRWLAQLPADVAHMIAAGNAERLFATPPAPPRPDRGRQ
jgi:predicted TIM-barrel fold metal-dependent hydrolase